MRIFYASLLAVSLFFVANVKAQSRAATFSFAYNTTADFTDFGAALTDGEGGIPDVAGVTYQVFFANASGVTDGTVRFYGYGNHPGDDNSAFLDGRKGYLYPLGQQDGFGPPAYQLVMQTADGSEFSFKSIYLVNHQGGTAAGQTLEVIGYRNGVATGQITAHADNAQFGLFLTQSTGLTPAVFQNVDKVVIRPTATSEFPSNFWYGINDIGFDNAVKPLPVRLASFDTRLQDGAVWLNWKTTLEQDNSHFIVERSADGNTFEALGRVAAITGNNAAAYSYKDRQPLAGKNYYRLVQYDHNGNQSISGTRMVDMGGGLSFSLYPNPATAGSAIMVSGRFAGPVQVQVINAAGQTVRTQRFPAASNNVVLNTSSLAPGTYQVVLTANGLVQSRPLLLVN